MNARVKTVVALVAASLILLTAGVALAGEEYLRITPFEGDSWAMFEGPLCGDRAFRVYRDLTEDGWYRAVIWYLQDSYEPSMMTKRPFLIIEFNGSNSPDHVHFGATVPIDFETLKAIYPLGPCQLVDQLRAV